MARKRGGLAGIFDRNKKWIKPVAAFTAGMINPALGAAVGAAMGGLDREGRGGIGFDLKQGAIGGATGYGLGKLGQAARGGLSGLFTASGAPASSAASAAPAAATASAPNAVTSAVPELLTGSKAALSRAGSFASKYAQPLGMAATAGANIMGSQAERANQQDALALQRERFGLEREQVERERERRRRIAELLMPLFQQEAVALNARRTPAAEA